MFGNKGQRLLDLETTSTGFTVHGFWIHIYTRGRLTTMNVTLLIIFCMNIEHYNKNQYIFTAHKSQP